MRSLRRPIKNFSQLAPWIAKQVGMGSVFATVWTWARIPVAVVLLVLVAALVYYLFPNTHQPFRFVTPGAVLAVIVWVRASLGSPGTWRTPQATTPPTVATVIVVLFYFFIPAAILLFGAELNSEVYHEAAEDEDQGSGFSDTARPTAGVLRGSGSFLYPEMCRLADVLRF